MNQLLLAFYADDFTGSTDALESLAVAGVPTVLFTSPPTPQQLARYPEARALGVAGMTRSMAPDEMSRQLAPAFQALKGLGAPVVHYKVCSTFDSSPEVGSLGPVIELGMATFGCRSIPVVVGAPSLGRYCVFGNLFARSGEESPPVRLDRHPSMSRHPVTPMNEADLRIHLSRQTRRSIGLVDINTVMRDPKESLSAFERAASAHEIVFIDLLHESNLLAVGRMIDPRDGRRFVIGSSGVESALCALWREQGGLGPPTTFQPPTRSSGPLLAACGSCSPVTAAQIAWAVAHGFAEVIVDPVAPDVRAACSLAAQAIGRGRNVVLHTGLARHPQPAAAQRLGDALGTIVQELIRSTGIRRLLVAGGDTSGRIARTLRIESMQMTASLARGAPLVRVSAPGSPADGMEMTFKGGQIGPVDFFGRVGG